MSKKSLIISMSIALIFFQPLSAADETLPIIRSQIMQREGYDDWLAHGTRPPSSTSETQKLHDFMSLHEDIYDDNGDHVCQSAAKKAVECVELCDNPLSEKCWEVQCQSQVREVTECLEGISSFPEPAAPIMAPVPMPNPFDQRQTAPQKDGYLEVEYKERAARSVSDAQTVRVSRDVVCGTPDKPCIGHGGVHCTRDDIIRAEVAMEDFHAERASGLLTGVASNVVNGTAPYACSVKEVLRNTPRESNSDTKKDRVIKLPAQEVIADNLHRRGFGYFVEKTKIDKALKREERLFDVAVAIDQAVNDFVKDRSSAEATPILLRKSDIVESILYNQPEAAEEVKKILDQFAKKADTHARLSSPLGYVAGDVEKQMAHQASEFSKARQQLSAAIKDAFVLVPTGSGSYKAEIRTEKDVQFYNAVERFSRMGDGIGSAISLFGGDKRTAHTVQAATVGLAKTAMSFYTGDIWGVLSGLNMLKGAFAKPDQSNQLMMRELFGAIQDLSRQMAANQEQIMYRFDRVDRRFDRIDEKLEDQKRLIIQEFFNLHKETGDIKKAIQKLATQAAEYHAQLQSNVAYTTQRMESGHAMLADSLVALRIEKVHQAVKDAQEDADRKELVAKDFDRHTKRLTRMATTLAAEPHLTGGKIEVTDLPAIQAALKTNSRKLWEHSGFANVNLLDKYAAHRCKMPHATLVNPLVWTQCADTVLTLFHKKLVDGNYPPTKEQHMLDMQRLNNLIQEGEKITDWVKTLDKAGVAQEVCKDYLQKLDHLAAVIQKRHAEYEAEQTLETREKQRKMVESEIAAVNTIPLEAPGYMAATTAWRNCLASISDGVCRGIKFDGIPDPTPLQDEVRHGSIARTGDLGRELIPTIEEHLRLLQAKSQALNGGDRVESGARIIYPATRHHKFPLLVHDHELPLKFRERDRNEIGDERFEYYVHDNVFYLCKYICEESGPKHLIGHIKLHYAPVSFYNNDENVRHFWYGGNYPKNWNTCATFVDGREVARGYYPPLTPYSGARYGLQAEGAAHVEIFEETRQLLKEKKKILDEQERVKFCKRIAAESEPSTKAIVFKAIQDLDVQCKLLDSYLTVIYNELMYDPKNPGALQAEFAVLGDSKVTYLKDGEALTRYFQEYSNPSSGLSKQEFALQHVKQTQETIEKTFQGILGLKLKVQFGQIVNVLDGLRELTARYRGRIITPIKIDTESQELVLALEQVAQKDKQIAEQHKHIEALGAVVTQARDEIQEMRKQMQLMMEMMSKMQKA